jgi:F-type H+-transporting ATPase subunit b
MNVLGIIASIAPRVGGRITASEFGVDSKGVTSHSPFLPETVEIIAGGIASLLVIGALVKFAGPMVMKSFAARTERIQKEIDAAGADKSAAEAEAAGIRQAKGDIAAERGRIMAEASAQAETILADGRTRLVTEVAELEARSVADIQAARGRVGDELRAEISRLSSAAVDHVVSGSLDDATHQELIENFIARVGAAK